MDEAVDAVGKVLMDFQEGLPVLQIEGRDRDLRFAVLLEPAVEVGIGVPFAVVALVVAAPREIEFGVRFLTDFLDGDQYFRIHRPGHKLDRARNQFRLVSEMKVNMAERERMVREIYELSNFHI